MRLDHDTFSRLTKWLQERFFTDNNLREIVVENCENLQSVFVIKTPQESPLLFDKIEALPSGGYMLKAFFGDEALYTRRFSFMIHDNPSLEENPPKLTQERVQKAISDECDAIKELLLAKNKAYGNSALDPVRIFSKASTEEQIRVRLDDKISRLQRGSAAGEDVEQDFMGYIILLRVLRRLSGTYDK